MSRRPLIEFVNEHGQTETGRRAGLSQGAIWQMLKSNRQIFVIEDDDAEQITLEEVRAIKPKTTAA